MIDSRMRDALLAAERPSAEMERLHRERLRNLAERRLTPGQRVAHALAMVAALVAAVYVAGVYVRYQAHIGPGAVLGLAVAFAWSVGWAIATAATLRAGADRVFTNGALRTWLVVGFAFVTGALLLWAALTSEDLVRSVHLAFFAIAFWCGIGLPFLVHQLVREAEVRTRTDVLHLERSLAEAMARREERP